MRSRGSPLEWGHTDDGQRDGEEPKAGGRSQVRPRLLLPSPGLAWPLLTHRTLSRRKRVEPGGGAGAGCLPVSFSGKRSVRLWRKLFFQMKEPFLERNTGEREKERRREKKEKGLPFAYS